MEGVYYHTEDEYNKIKEIYKYTATRLKKDIKLVGKSPKGIKIYNFKYIGDDKTYQGVMAHQVPQAATANEFGYLMVDYSKLDVEFKEV